MNPKLSIIMPVYNAEEYLEMAVESVMSQTFKEWELILIDDGSKDNSGEICNKFSEKDKRVKVIRQENKGVSETKGRGLKAASGRYIGFVDSDDYIDSKMYEVLIDELEKSQSDLVICGFTEEKIVNEEILYRKKKSYNHESPFNLSDIKDEVMEFFNSELINSNWNKVYRKEVITKNNVKFPLGVKTGEDLMFNLDYLVKIGKISLVDECFYHYTRRRNDSITHQYMEDVYSKGLKIHKKVKGFLKELNLYTEKNQDILEKNHLIGVFSAILNLYHRCCPLSSNEKKIYIDRIIKRKYVRTAAKKNRGRNFIGLISVLIGLQSPTLIMVVFQLLLGLREVRRKWER